MNSSSRELQLVHLGSGEPIELGPLLYTRADPSAEEQQWPWLWWPESVQRPPHTVTFYSFKGGVGRTLALLNVALLLARRGNRVAIADFDLEAPGVDAYSGFRPPSGDQRGVMEFLASYLDDPRKFAPSCADYVYQVKLAKNFPKHSAIYVMRAGRQDDAYRRNLARLDWNTLMSRQDGGALLENLKFELFDDYGCNFLLVDSRTGLNDVAGLCTGTLADAVVLMFYPDEQNARGISEVGKAIRLHADRHKCRIDRMYCVSRVPNVVEREQAAREVLEHVLMAAEGRCGPAGKCTLLLRAPDEGAHQQLKHTTFVRVSDPPAHNDVRLDRLWHRDALEQRLEQYLPCDVAKLDLTHLQLDGFETDFDSTDDPPTTEFGGLACTMILERPGLAADIVALQEPESRRCEPYWQMTLFARLGNVFDRASLERIADGFVDLPSEEDIDHLEHELEQRIRKSPTLRNRWSLSGMAKKAIDDAIARARETLRERLEELEIRRYPQFAQDAKDYCARWHPDIRFYQLETDIRKWHPFISGTFLFK